MCSGGRVANAKISYIAITNAQCYSYRALKLEQVSAFLGALHGSGVMRRALILCPATVLSHWMTELHVWAPQLRVVVLHRCVQAFNAVSGNSGADGKRCLSPTFCDMD